MIKYCIYLFLLISTQAYSQTFLFSQSKTVTPPAPPTPGVYDYYVDGNNSGSEDGSEAHPYNTIGEAAAVATSTKTIFVKNGIYRETITPASGTIWVAESAAAIISGLNQVNTSWSVHSSNIYKTTITLPAANNYNEYIGGTGYNGQDNTSNTQLLANQIFKDGVMQMHARYPKMYSPEDQMNKGIWRKAANTVSWGDNQLVDNALTAFGISNFNSVWIVMNGWFMTQTRQASSGSGNTINWSTATTGPGSRFRKYYYITNHLNLLTTAKEWHYQSGVLYFWQNGGGSPTGVEYKARNFAFNLRDRTGVTIKGFSFKGCDPVQGNSGTSSNTVDNIRASYMNHAMIAANIGDGGNTRNASQSGTKVIGTNNIIRNSEFRYGSSMAIWAGTGSLIENNYFDYIDYDGSWGAPIRPWENADDIIIRNNTSVHSGRGAVEMSGDEERNNTNLDIGYNDFSFHNMLSIDGGAIYTQLWSNHNLGRIHHNWFHDTGMYYPGFNNDEDGVQISGIYFDQGSGAGPTGTITMDHNVHWNGPEADFYTQTGFEGRDGGHKNIYNNTNAGQGSGRFGTQNASFVTYDHSTYPAKQRNNINRGQIINQNNTLDNANSISQGTDPLFVGGDLSTLKGLYFRLQSTSPARNTGVVIPGITDGYAESLPDIGAYEYGVAGWTAGYVAKPYTP